jgi:hypothetical protein
VRVNARGQKLEYLWYDGQEGTPQKVSEAALFLHFWWS